MMCHCVPVTNGVDCLERKKFSQCGSMDSIEEFTAEELNLIEGADNMEACFTAFDKDG